MSRQEKVAHGSREVVHCVLPQNGQLVADGAEEPQVVVHRHERKRVQHARGLDGLVRRQDLEEVSPLLGGDGDLREVVAVVDLEEIEKRVGRVGVVSAEGLQAELPVHEDDGIAGFEEVLCGGCASRSWGRVRREIDRWVDTRTGAEVIEITDAGSGMPVIERIRA